MKITLLAVALALGIPAATALASGEGGGGIFPYPPVIRNLTNGLRVVLIRTPFPGSVALHVTVGAGSRNEVEAGKSGFAHFFEHMMFRGTERFPAEVYGEILKRAGADQNAYTTDDYTNYHTTFAKEDLETVLELEADRFRNLKYTVDQFKTEARAVLGEYNKNYANPILKLMEVQRDRVFRVHTYKHTTMGFLRDIEAMPTQFEYSRSFYDRFYRPERTVLTVVGDIDPETTLDWVETHWGGWERGGYESAIPAEPPQDGPITGHVAWESPTLPWVVVGFRGPAFAPEGKATACMDVLATILFSESSDLYQRLVVRDRIVDQLFAYFPHRKDPYLLSVFARVVDADRASEVRDAILGEFARAREERLSRDLVDRTKAHLKYAFVQSLDSNAAIADVLARFVHFQRDPGTLDALYRSYEAITPEDLEAAAAETFVRAGVHVLTLSAGTLPGDWGSVPPVESLARKPLPGRLEEVRLATESPLVDLRILFLAGAADDPPGKEGLAALTAAMVTDAGSASRPFKEITDLFYPMAASFSNQVDKEMTVFRGSLHRDNVAAYWEIASEMLLDPGWRDSDFERLRTRQKNAILVDLVGNNDEELGKEVLYGAIYVGHPYGRLNLGSVASLDRLTLEDCRRFHAEHYTRANLVLGIAGGIDETVLGAIRADLACLPAGADPGNPAGVDASLPAPPCVGRSATIVAKDTRATAISWGFPIEVTRSHPDFTALWLVRSWLGEHRSSNSHLYQRIREERGMNYGDYAYIEYFPRGMFLMQPEPNLGRRSQIFQVWIRPVVPENALFAVRASLFEFEKMLRDGLTQEQFEATRDYLTKYVNLLVATQDRRLAYALDSRYYGIGEFAAKVREELASLTLDEVNRAMRDHLRPAGIRFVFVTKDAEGLRDLLVADAPSTIRYDGEKSEALLAEDRRIGALKLGLRPGEIRIVDREAVFAGGEAR